VASGRRGAPVAQGAQPRGGVACAVAATADRSQTLRVAAAICRYCARSIPLRQRTRTASGTRACDLFGKELRFHARQYACAPMRSWVHCWRGAIGQYMRCEAYVRGRLGKQEPSSNAFHVATVRVPMSSPLHARSRSARAAPFHFEKKPTSFHSSPSKR
jgi:hypothetical protein